MIKQSNDFKLFARDHGVSSSVFDDYTKSVNNTYIEPTIVEERRLNATSISVFSRLFMDRILFIGSGIDNDVANIVNSQLLYLEMQDSDKPVTMYINSPGGSVYDGLSIYDVMNYVNCPVVTTCIGIAASMGAVLLTSGEKGKRTALKHSKIMIHEPSTVIGPIRAKDLEVEAGEMVKCKETLYRILSENSGKTYEEIAELCKLDKWYSSDEAIANGMIDTIITKKK